MTVFLFAAIVAGSLMTCIIATISANFVGCIGFRLPAMDRRIGHIDGLRGYLALSVLIHHFIYWIQVTRLGGAWNHLPIHFFNQLGEGAVTLFFMATGCVFYPRVLAGFRSCSWPVIYTTRFFRITPLVAFSVMIVTIVIMVRTGRGLDRDFPISAFEWITTWGEPQLLGYPESWRLNANVLWSLRYEWMFYLFVLPACALAMDVVRGRLPSWTLSFTLLVVTLGARMLHLGGAVVFYLPLFAVGMLAYELQRHNQIVHMLRTTAMTIAAVIALGLGLSNSTVPYNIASLLFGFFFICVACGNSMGGVLRTRGASVLGECSYGIYLLHGLVLSIAFVDGDAIIGKIPTEYLPFLLPLLGIAVVILTSATYIFVERPAMRVGRRLAEHWSGRRLRLTTPELERAP